VTAVAGAVAGRRARNIDVVGPLGEDGPLDTPDAALLRPAALGWPALAAARAASTNPDAAAEDGPLGGGGGVVGTLGGRTAGELRGL